MALGRKPLRAAPALLVAAILAGCGAGEQLSQAEASRLQATLDEVAERNDQGDCAGASSSVVGLRRQVRALDRDVDEDLRNTLRASTAHLAGLVRRKCAQPTPAPTISEPQPELTEPPQTTPTEPETDSGGEQPDQGGGEQGGTEKEGEEQQDKAEKAREEVLKQLEKQQKKQGGKEGRD